MSVLELALSFVCLVELGTIMALVHDLAYARGRLRQFVPDEEEAGE